MMRFGPAALALALLSVYLTGAGPSRSNPHLPHSPTDNYSDGTELLVLTEKTTLRWKLDVEVDGTPVAKLWTGAFDRLFAFADRNGDGSLDRKEASRLPSATALRHARFTGEVGRPPPWGELDRNGHGAISHEELAGYYRQAGLGNVLIGIGKPRATDALTESLLNHLHAGNGNRTGSQWLAPDAVLRQLDQNDDELIGPGELVAGLTYPGAAGTSFLSAPSPTDKPAQLSDSLPLLLLPANKADTQWTVAFVRRRDRDGDGRLNLDEARIPAETFRRLDSDHDGKLTPNELMGWRELEPDVCWKVRLGACAGGQPMIQMLAQGSADRQANGQPVALALDRFRLTLRADEGKVPEMWQAARNRFLTQFALADIDHNGFVGAARLASPRTDELHTLLVIADRDQDNQLSAAELAGWLELQDAIARAYVLMTVLDHGMGLFEQIDADGDGALSVRELRSAWSRLQKDGCISDGQFERDKLPRQIRITVSRGYPQSLLNHAPRPGPAWFQAMDRNGDGDISRKEWIGKPELFDQLDADHDGLISPDEAQKLKR